MTIRWPCQRETMQFRMALLSAAFLAGLSASWAASLFNDAAEKLNGEWRGDDFVLRVDARRAQASTAPDRPFEWERFLIKEVIGNEVVFSIGPEIFEAIVDADTLVLTGTAFRGEQVLLRDGEAGDSLRHGNDSE